MVLNLYANLFGKVASKKELQRHGKGFGTKASTTWAVCNFSVGRSW